MPDVFQITITPPPAIRITVAGLVPTGDTLVVSKFTGVTGLETSYTAGAAGSTGGPLAGSTPFIASKEGAGMKIITAGDPAVDEIKVVGNAVSWQLPLNAGGEIIIIAK